MNPQVLGPSSRAVNLGNVALVLESGRHIQDSCDDHIRAGMGSTIVLTRPRAFLSL